MTRRTESTMADLLADLRMLSRFPADLWPADTLESDVRGTMRANLSALLAWCGPNDHLITINNATSGRQPIDYRGAYWVCAKACGLKINNETGIAG